MKCRIRGLSKNVEKDFDKPRQTIRELLGSNCGAALHKTNGAKSKSTNAACLSNAASNSKPRAQLLGSKTGCLSWAGPDRSCLLKVRACERAEPYHVKRIMKLCLLQTNHYIFLLFESFSREQVSPTDLMGEHDQLDISLHHHHEGDQLDS